MSPWSWGFRRGLRRALPEWVDEGVISEDSAEALRERYQLEKDVALDAASLAVYMFGAILVFGGLASFVAWQWAAVTSAAKLVVGVATMVGVLFLGWKVGWADRRSSALGQALVVLGVLAFGPNLSLLLDVLGVDPTEAGLLAWSGFAAGFAVVLRSAPAAAVTALAGFGWLVFLPESVPGGLILVHGAWMGVLIWAAHLRSSALAATGVAGGAAAALAWVLAEPDASLGTAGFEVGLAFAAAALALGGGRWAGVQGLGIVVAVSVAFVLGFEEAARAFTAGIVESPTVRLVGAVAPAFLVGALALVRARPDDDRGERAAGFATALLLAGAAFSGPVAILVAAHLLLVTRIVLDLRRSLTALERGPFWTAVLLAVSVIGARFLEIQTGLWVKALAFVAAGVTVMILGAAFERRRRSKDV